MTLSEYSHVLSSEDEAKLVAGFARVRAALALGDAAALAEAYGDA
jgi:hypothetical protein